MKTNVKTIATDATADSSLPGAHGVLQTSHLDSSQTSVTTVSSRLRSLLLIPEIGILIPLTVLTIGFSIINPALLRPESIGAMLRGLAFVGIISIGQTLLMVSGELDLSVGSVSGLCAIISAWLMTHGVSVPCAVIGGLAAGAVIGFINGLLTVGVGLPAFIATLGMLYVTRGLDYLISGGIPIYPLPPALASMEKLAPTGISWALLIFVFLAIVGEFGLRKTTFGRALYATGGNPEVARLAGISTNRIKIACYVLSGTLAALAGFLQTAQFNVGQPEMGTGAELEVIAGVVIGGVSLFGGVGTILGTVLGLLLMQIVKNGLVHSHVNSHWQTIAVGVTMMAAVSVDLLRRRSKVG